MCGIGFIYKMGKRPIRKWHLQQMAIELEHRGRDATGFATQEEDGQMHVWKIAKPAWHATQTKSFHEWADECITPKVRILLVHTRAFTKGSPHNVENNHPLYADPIQGILVHNGMVRNDDELFKQHAALPGFKRSCVTDSDAFRAILDNWGKVDKKLIKQMQLADATAAVLAIHRASPGKLLILRDQNPLVLGATADMLAGASTKEALHKVLKPWIKLHNLDMQVHAPDLSFVPMPNETGYIVGPKGVEVHDEFKCNGRIGGGYTKYYKNTEYHSRQLRAKQAAVAEKRYNGGTVVNPTVHAKVTTLIAEGADAPTVDAVDAKSNVDNPNFNPRTGLFEYVICPNAACNAHVELSDSDRLLDDIKLLVCTSCNTNLAGALDASLSVN